MKSLKNKVEKLYVAIYFYMIKIKSTFKESMIILEIKIMDLLKIKIIIFLVM